MNVNRDQDTIMTATINMLAFNLNNKLLIGGKNPLGTSQCVLDQSYILCFVWYGYIALVIRFHYLSKSKIELRSTVQSNH